MSALLFSPHNDDETLFAFYSILEHRPRVIVVLRSYRQWLEQHGPTAELRERETKCAMKVAGVEYEQWGFPDNDIEWHSIALLIANTINEEKPDVVLAPAWEAGGHEDHNSVASIVSQIPGDFKRIYYLTYKRGHGRSTSKHEVESDSAGRAKKLTALSCYRSQTKHGPTAAWFPGGAYFDHGEWVE